MKRILFALLFVAGSANAAIVDVEKLNQVLKKTNAGWVAKTNELNELSIGEAKMHFGLAKPVDSVRFSLPQKMTPQVAGLPAVLDWRNKDGVNWVSPVLDQGNCGSCVAFASIATLETQYKISTGFSNFNIKLSPQSLFSCGGGHCDFGWQPASAARYIQSSGVPEESCMPYTAGATGKDAACSARCADAPARSVKIASFTTPTRTTLDVNAVKTALQNGPLVTTLGVYADFMVYSSGVYKHTTGELEGGHAVSIVGYDDNQQAFIIRNSWNTSWGEQGFAYVAYSDYSGVGDDTWQYVMPSLAGGVSTESPMDYTYVTGKLPVQANSTFGGTDSITYSIFDANNKSVAGGMCTGANCTDTVDVSTFADGRYEIETYAMGANGQQLGHSVRQFFYVANSKPALNLTFTGTNGTDLRQPLKDRIEVAVTATSSSVPMSSVEFHYRGADGVDNSRAADVVVSGMTMGWRTNLGPNGSYEIWMVGHVKTTGFDQVYETPHMTVTVAN